MQPLAVVQSFDKGSDGALALGANCDSWLRFLFLLLGFHEGFGLGLVVRMADAGSCWRRFS
jgi:hypothetical protein